MNATRSYEERFRALHCDRPGGRPRPHKAVMLLAVSLLAEADELTDNRIEFCPRLLEIFRSLFDVAKQDTDQCTPYNPFFYLKSEGFWHLHPSRGGATALSQLSNIRGPGQLRDAVAYASLDPELFALLHDPDARRALQATLIQTYCAHVANAMWKVLQEEAQIETRKQGLLREQQETGAWDLKVRSTAFRRMIREIYDVRCAACGIRFFFEDIDLIDAAHLVPFSQTQDDRPQNGIALCKNHHWLMDHNIIVPGPGRGQNYRRPMWHVRKGLDDRFEEHKPVLELKHRSVILPAESRYTPSREGLEWRMERLRAEEEGTPS